MPNALFQTFGGASGRQAGQRNLAPQLLEHIRGFQGNPIQILQEKMNSGEMTQEQYTQLRSAAESIAQKMFGVQGRTSIHTFCLARQCNTITKGESIYGYCRRKLSGSAVRS